MPQTFYEFGGIGKLMHIAVANGFPPLTYTPLLKPFITRYRVISLPPRPLWSNPPTPTTFHSWVTLADDLLTGLRTHDLNEVIAVGHSFGAIASLIAAAREPERFRALILLDPTIMPPLMLRAIGILKRMGVQNPLVKQALKRRSTFADHDDAFAYWRAKRLFSDWSDDTLRLYVESMTQPTVNGAGLSLTWSPEWEARFFDTLLTTTWRYIPDIRGKLPMLTLRGSESTTFVPRAAQRLCRMLPEMAYAEIDGHGHLFPHSAPDATYEAIDGWLQRVGL